MENNKDPKPEPKQEKPEPCKHERYYIAVRHESGLVVRRCSICGVRV